jgi:uncharacterized protein YdbL (DUF1318 family)
MKITLRFLALFALAFFAFGARAAADEVSDAKQRIASRQGEVAALKTKGAIGENNRGFLEVRDGGGNAAQVVADENRDRGVLYAEAARRTGASAEEAGKARARQIAAASAPGVWVQKEDGTWAKK